MRPRSLRVVALLALFVPAAASASTQFLRRPDVHGDAIVFTSEGDLWLGSIEKKTAMRITSDEGTEGPARFSPDGKTLAFTAQYDGGTDVYMMDLEGGAPRRLTYDPAGAVVQGWSPDGAEILFRSKRNSAMRRRLWAVSVKGGSPRLLPIPYGEFASMDPAGTRIAYVPVSAEWQHWKRYQGGMADDIWITDLTSHTFRKLTDDPGVDTEPVWVGEAIYFVSERDGHANLYRLGPQSGTVSAATHYADYDVRYPGTDGHRVVFEHGDGLALFDPATGQTQELDLALHSDRIHARERRLSALDNFVGVDFGPTGKRLLISSRGQILSAPVENGDVRNLPAPPGGRCQYPAWSPDGKQVAFVSDASGEEQIWIASASALGSAKQLTRDHKGPLGPLVWSPDGALLTTSDREMRIFIVNAKTGALTLVDQADRGGSYDLVNDTYRFSPDSKWLAFSRLDPNWNWVIVLYDIAHKTQTRVTSSEMTSTAPAFDPDGKYLYFLSDRSFDPRYVNANRYFSFDKMTKVSLVTLSATEKSPFLTDIDEETSPADSAAEKGEKNDAKKGKTGAKALRVDTAGLADRVVEVPVPADRYVRVEPAPGRLFLETLETTDDHDPDDAVRQLRFLDMKKKNVSVLVDTLTDFQLSADGKKLLLQDEKDFTVVDASVDQVPEDKDGVDTDAWMLTLNPVSEWKQIFEEGWRIGRDFFYDPKMHGVDWDAVRRKYEAMLPAVADRSDLTFILGEMVAELNCGHAYVGAGDAPNAPTVPMGFLGADFEPVPGQTPAYRVTKIYPGDGFDLAARSPLLLPGVDVKAGDYILAVMGRAVRTDEDLEALLVGTANRWISLTVNTKPSRDGAREVHLKPLASERLARYYDWVAQKREYVRTHGGENLGYVHLPNMSNPGLQEFAKHYYPNLAKDGMIYDVRFNNGGYIDAMLLLQMATKPYSYFKPRYGASWTRLDWGFAGYSVALCNEYSISDGEEFSDAFQRLGLGPVIGSTTWGGEVGSGSGYPLADGGTIYIPNYGEWVPDGHWVIEGTGVKPDIMVEDDPAALMAGKDPQLDRAIQVLKEKIQAQPVPRPVPPPFPNKALGAGSGGPGSSVRKP
jgi:tricorn protease